MVGAGKNEGIQVSRIERGCLALVLFGVSACSEPLGATDVESRAQELTQLRIEAENFARFFDSDTLHNGNCNSGPVDAEYTSDPSGGQCNVGWTTAGEWLEYDINIPQSGTFDFVFRVASANAGRTMHLEVDGVNVSGSIVSPSSGWQSFQNRTVSGVGLSAGPHVLRVVFDTGELNLNYIDVNQTSATETYILNANFSDGTDGFIYYDVSANDYADGGQQSGRLRMVLGGLDDTVVEEISGKFFRSFFVSSYTDVTLSFDYTLERSCYYEADEVSELRATLDGAPLSNGNGQYLARLSGSSGSCPHTSVSGTFSATYGLNPGKHQLEIIGFNNKKTFHDETTAVSVDNVKVTTTGAVCSPPLSQTYTNLCGACGGLLNCGGSCTVSIATDVGAPCGSCGGVVTCDGSCSEPLTAPCGAPPTAQERHAACATDPRVVAGLVSRDTCTGADIFFRETFEGNGRTCGSCHPVANNYTIDPTFVQALAITNPNDPLFVAKPGTPLAHLETTDLMDNALILENVDGFQDPANRFVSRSVPHLYSLAITLAADPADGSTTPPLERTGWGGDGAPGDGSLHAFLEGAINQHFTKRLDRVPGVDFREATEFEKDVVETFQLGLGRQNELDLASVNFSLESAEIGKDNFLDPARGRCGVCHSNAGANFVNSGLNRNFNNGIVGWTTLGRLLDYYGPGEDLVMTDAGFGGAELTNPNFDVTRGGVNNGFGDGNFNVPSLVEAADTAPFFHSNASVGSVFQTTLGRIMFFYGTTFASSSGAQFLDSQPEFGPGDINSETTTGIASMLVVLNAVFNIDLARQRLSAAQTLATDLQAIRADVQVGLMLLSAEEVEDAIRVLADENIHQAEQVSLQAILNLLQTASVADSWSARRADIITALSELNNLRPAFGSNFDYQLGNGTLMY